MDTTPFVRRYLNNLPEGAIFDSRELLIYGTRNTIDGILFRLTRTGELVRVARGVFQKSDGSSPSPTVFGVTSLKAQSSGQSIKLTDSLQEKTVTFWTDGASSSFKCGDVRVILKKVSSRKLKLAQSGKMGMSLALLWQLGKGNVTKSQALAAVSVNAFEREALKELLPLTPDWLASMFKP